MIYYVVYLGQPLDEKNLAHLLVAARSALSRTT